MNGHCIYLQYTQIKINLNLIIHIPCFLHHRCITAVAGTAGLTQEHVEVVPVVVALLEALRAEGHARGYAARATPICDKVRCPHQPACRRVVIRTN